MGRLDMRNLRRVAPVLVLAAVLVAFSQRSGQATAQTSATPSLDAAVAQVSEEVAYVRPAVPREPRAYLDALAALDYTVGHVNAALYGWRNTIAKLPLPACATIEGCAENSLEQGAGICGNAATVFVGILRRLGVSAHMLNLFYRAPDGTRGGHTTAEVFWRGRWHMMDPTWGVFFRRPNVEPSAILSHAQVTKLIRPSRYIVQDRSHFWWQVSSHELHQGWVTGFNALLDAKARAVVVHA
jgi:hypothetical protein